MASLRRSLPLSILFPLLVSPAAAAGSDGVSPSAYTIFEVFGLPVTNSMLTTWLVSILLIVVFRVWCGRPQLVPSAGQAVVENLVDGLRGLLEPIVGKKAFPLAFPLLTGLFVFIMVNNWSGLIPGIGTIGTYDEHGHLIYWFRPATSDLNATLGMALLAMAAWLFISIRVAGPGFFLHELFGNKADRKETPPVIYWPLWVIFIGVGFIEIVSILFRPVSLSFRLYGNVFGGENLLTSMTGLIPVVVPAVFYFYEVLVGVVQALIFTLLIAIYIGLMTNHGDEHDH